MEYISTLLSIFTLNLVLSGDNAVVIAMASRNLPSNQQKKAILFGSAGAILFRIILTVVIFYLLKIPLLQCIGGIILIYIAIKLLRQEEGGEEIQSASGLMEAVKIIILADIMMSLDNTLAIVAVSGESWLMLLIGLATSIPIIIFCSKIIIHFMNKYPIIIYIGAGLLAWTSGKMIIEDKKVSALLTGSMSEIGNIIFPLLITVIVLLYGWYFNIKSKATVISTNDQNVNSQ